MNKEGIVESLLFAAGDEGLTADQLAFVLQVEKAQVIQLAETMQKNGSKTNQKGSL